MAANSNHPFSPSVYFKHYGICNVILILFTILFLVLLPLLRALGIVFLKNSVPVAESIAYFSIGGVLVLLSLYCTFWDIARLKRTGFYILDDKLHYSWARQDHARSERFDTVEWEDAEGYIHHLESVKITQRKIIVKGNRRLAIPIAYENLDGLVQQIRRRIFETQSFQR